MWNILGAFLAKCDARKVVHPELEVEEAVPWPFPMEGARVGQAVSNRRAFLKGKGQGRASGNNLVVSKGKGKWR